MPPFSSSIGFVILLFFSSLFFPIGFSQYLWIYFPISCLLSWQLVCFSLHRLFRYFVAMFFCLSFFHFFGFFGLPLALMLLPFLLRFLNLLFRGRRLAFSSSVLLPSLMHYYACWMFLANLCIANQHIFIERFYSPLSFLSSKLHFACPLLAFMLLYYFFIISCWYSIGYILSFV